MEVLMKTLWTGLLLMMLAIVPLAAVRGDFSVSFTPRQVWVNQFNTASFDPMAPDEQPVMTSLSLSKNNGSAVIKMKVEIKWNSVGIIDAVYRSKQPITNAPLLLTNRDLITKQGSEHFVKISGGEVDFDAIIDSSPVLEDAVLAGYFPDGNLTIKISVLDDTAEEVWTNADTDMFTITVYNNGVINPLSPGVSIGNLPPMVSIQPVNYMWNAINTGFNRTWITIREYPPNFPPEAGNVGITGTLFYEGEVPANATNFGDFLAYNKDHYYAWRIVQDNFTEMAPNLSGPSTRAGRSSQLASNWFVFRFMANDSTTQSVNVIQAILNQLNNVQIDTTFQDGFLPTGTVIYEGRFYTGQDAVDLVESLLGQAVQVRITQ